MGNESERPVELIISWSAVAHRSFMATVTRINSQDQRTAALVAQRVKRALDILVLQPEIGTPVVKTSIRRFVIPKTGHLIDYQVRGTELLIVH